MIIDERILIAGCGFHGKFQQSVFFLEMSGASNSGHASDTAPVICSPPSSVLCLSRLGSAEINPSSNSLVSRLT